MSAPRDKLTLIPSKANRRKAVNDASAVDCVGAPSGCDMSFVSGGLVLIP